MGLFPNSPPFRTSPPQYLVAVCATALLLACETELIAEASSADAGAAGVLEQCIGPHPAALAWQATPTTGGGTVLTTPVLGATPPPFTLPDAQPQSCGYRAVYGLQTFVGKVTVVALLAGW